MKERWTGVALLLLSAMLLQTAPASAAAPTPQTSLNNCQKAAKVQGARYVRGEMLAIATCLQKISTEVIRNNASIDASAARTCITQFRKIKDTRGLGKSLKEKLSTKIRLKCDPTFNPGAVTHTTNDVTGHGPGNDPQQINTKNLDQWCQNFGGDGSIDSVQEWVDCITAAHECEVEQAIAEQYPRASEWLTAVKPIMNALPSPTNDPTRTSDAVAGVTAVDTAIDADGDNKPDLHCPSPPAAPTCATACCYIEQVNGGFRPTSCFQYTGPTGSVTTFKNNCQGKQSSPPLFWSMSAVDGVCTAGPMFGVACTDTSASGNEVIIPQDATCP